MEYLAALNDIEHPVLVHYGRFETKFLKEMAVRYGAPARQAPAGEAVAHPINLLTHIYGHVYFPTLSNGLKPIARHLGFEWSDPSAGGLVSIVWRERWHSNRDAACRESLIRYNAEDCEALGVVTKKVCELAQASPSNLGDVVDATLLKREKLYKFKRNSFCLPELDAINSAAYWDYQRERIYVRTVPRLKKVLPRKCVAQSNPSINKTVDLCERQFCPRCNSANTNKHEKMSKVVIDLRFAAGGVKRWVTRYQFHRYRCQVCKSTFNPHNLPWTRYKYGPGIWAYSIYHCIAMRMSIEGVCENINRLFGISLDLNELKAKAANIYRIHMEMLMSKIVSGRLVHADETKISVKGRDGYVWVFTSMEEVVYLYSETREGGILDQVLKGFTGVLVSDFYTAYDSVPCAHQKCLIHLMRDLNDAVLKHPYDEELKWLVRGFADLVKPMIETVDRFGLKSHFLRKHLQSVARFYRNLSKCRFHTEMATKLKERFLRNRDKLFTFLNHDGVPWNNNNAEHAVKAFAGLRNVIGGVTSENGIRDYLVLLSICETCKYRGLDFLDFLLSGEKDIEAYTESRRMKRQKYQFGG